MDMKKMKIGEREREEWETKGRVSWPSQYPALLYLTEFAYSKGLLAKVRECAREP